jgi:hypothetical protein
MLFRGLLAEPGPWGRRSVAPIQADSTATLNIQGGRVATERDDFERATWRVMVAAVVEPERLIFVEKCGTHTSLAPIYGLRAQRRAAVSVGTQKPGQEHYAAFEHDALRDGAVA